jgi:hypothetical protein
LARRVSTTTRASTTRATPTLIAGEWEESMRQRRSSTRKGARL